MTRIVLAALALALAGCGQAPTTETKSSPNSDQVAVTAGGNPCALVADTVAVFGRQVSAENAPMPNMCTWRSADAVVSGSIIVHGAGWSPVSDAEQAYAQMLEPIEGMGTTRAVEGIGEQAVALDMGASQTQIFFRKGAAAVNVGASSSDPALTNAMLADRIARAAAERL